ncbi:hypothetical protein D9M72_567950 [compost metagenome]
MPAGKFWRVSWVDWKGTVTFTSTPPRASVAAHSPGKLTITAWSMCVLNTDSTVRTISGMPPSSSPALILDSP